MENELLWNCLSQPLLESKSKYNIEDGLLRPENKEVFLTSSIAFLHQRLLQKIESDVRIKTDNTEKKYSDLLIVTTDSEQSRTIYVKLKNINKFEEAMKNESSFPNKKLSIDQILPKPGAVKIPNGKKSVLSIFNKKSSLNATQSFNFLNIFRKSSKDCSQQDDEEDDYAPETCTTKSKMEIVIKFLQSIPSEPHLPTPVPSGSGKDEEEPNSLQSLRSLAHPPKELELSDFSLPLIIKSNYPKTIGQNLSKDEIDFINKISPNPGKKLRVSKSETFPIYKNLEPLPSICSKCHVCEYCLRSNNCDFNEKVNYDEKNHSISKNVNRRPTNDLKKALSKISVCLDDEQMDDYEEIEANSSSIFYSSLEDIRNNLTPEVLKDIIRKFVENLETIERKK